MWESRTVNIRDNTKRIIQIWFSFEYDIEGLSFIVCLRKESTVIG